LLSIKTKEVREKVYTSGGREKWEGGVCRSIVVWKKDRRKGLMGTEGGSKGKRREGKKGRTKRKVMERGFR